MPRSSSSQTFIVLTTRSGDFPSPFPPINPRVSIPRPIIAMPLIVPGITSQPGNKTEEWQNKLVGKKLSDTEHTETVSQPNGTTLAPYFVCPRAYRRSSSARKTSRRSTASLGPARPSPWTLKRTGSTSTWTIRVPFPTSPTGSPSKMPVPGQV